MAGPDDFAAADRDPVAIDLGGTSLRLVMLALPFRFFSLVASRAGRRCGHRDADFYVRAAVNTGRFRSGAWRAVARRSGVGAGDD